MLPSLLAGDKRFYVPLRVNEHDNVDGEARVPVSSILFYFLGFIYWILLLYQSVGIQYLTCLVCFTCTRS